MVAQGIAPETEGLDGPSALLFLCEHASCAFPSTFGTLGLSENVMTSHVAWDPGALPLARDLAAAFTAPLVAGSVSRLLYDCNRPPEAPDAIPQKSEIYEIAGNAGLSAADRAQRVEAIYRPFCAAVDHAIAVSGPAAIVTVHTFTPTYFGKRRAVEIGVLHDNDSRLADAMLTRATGQGFDVRRNEPYGPADGVTHSLRLHAQPRGLLNVMLEIRSDLVSDASGVARVRRALTGMLVPALADHGVVPEGVS